EPPDTAGDSGVEIADARFACTGGPALRVTEVRVAAVDEHVAGLEQAEQRPTALLRRIAGRHHHPNDARRLQLRHQLLERGYGPSWIGAGVGLDLVAVSAQALGHVAAHAAEPDEAEFHAETSSPRFARMPSSNSWKEASNFSTPSSSSVSVTSSTSTPSL